MNGFHLVVVVSPENYEKISMHLRRPLKPNGMMVSFRYNTLTYVQSYFTGSKYLYPLLYTGILLSSTLRQPGFSQFLPCSFSFHTIFCTGPI